MESPVPMDGGRNGCAGKPCLSEAGGPATQAGIYYQNSVAALALADLLDLDHRLARERVTDVRLEAPEDVDDVVIRFADGHQEFQNIKLSIRVGNAAWSGIWRSFSDQCSAPEFGNGDQLTLVVSKRNDDSEATAEVCERARTSVDTTELRGRLSRPQLKVFDSVSGLLGGDAVAVDTLRRVQLRYLPLKEIERDLARRRLADAATPPPSILPILRGIAGGDARRRGVFQSAPLRRRLRREHNILLCEPPEWGLAAYRSATKQLSRIEIPGLGVSGPTEKLFVWPRARPYDRARRADFEDESLIPVVHHTEEAVDLRAFPNNELAQVIVVAGPGYGKSALLTAIAGELVQGPMVPVHVPLASLASTSDSVIAYLGLSISREMDLSADWQRLAEQGLLVLLLDGLDEVPAAQRPTLMNRIATFSVRYPNAPWMLTVRDAAVVTGLAAARMVELLPLHDEDIERFVATMQPHLRGLRSWEFVNRLKAYPDLDRLARIPLFLTILIATSATNIAAPLTRSDLIETYLRTLFTPGRHKTVRDQTDYSVALRAVAETLAFERLERQEIGATEREVRAVIDRVATSSGEASGLFEQLVANGIMKPQSAIRWQFPYPIVQEYLAARHLVDRHPETLGERIEDAMQRPWAQVIQFALELHPKPEPIIRAMLERPDDAFCTGLRLVGRCIASGAAISSQTRTEVCNRLVEYWIHAPTRSRERVGRLLADGFSTPLSPALEAALHHRWLIEHGAGEIVSKVSDPTVTCRVLSHLIEDHKSSIRIYHSLKPALRQAGDIALQLIVDALDPEVRGPSELVGISSLFHNFTPSSVSRDLALSVARDKRLPAQIRLRAYKLAGPPLEQVGVALAIAGLRHPDWDANYAASDLFEAHEAPVIFLAALLRDDKIPLERRRELAAKVTAIIPGTRERAAFLAASISEPTLDPSLRIALQLFAARLGDRHAIERLIEQIGTLPIQDAGTAIALLGHFPDRVLGERAADLARKDVRSPEGMVRIASSASTGMRYIFEMDFGFGGALRTAPAHPAIGSWQNLVEDWSATTELSQRDRLSILTAAAELGSDKARHSLQVIVLSIDDFDAPEWLKDDKEGHTMSSALRQVQKWPRFQSPEIIKRLLSSKRYNIAARGIDVLEASGSKAALHHLVQFYESDHEWHLRDTTANAIELLAARLGVTVQKETGLYRLLD